MLYLYSFWALFVLHEAVLDNNMEYPTSHLYFLGYTHEPLGECVYEENTKIY